MTDREKLFNLIGQVQDCGCDVTDVVEMNYVENEVLVDHLIANGVTVLGCNKDCANCWKTKLVNPVATDNNVGDKMTPTVKPLTNCQQTNGDRIRSMSDEELAKWISGGAMESDSACSYCEHNKNKTCTGKECQGVTDAEIIMKWLQQPAEED